MLSTAQYQQAALEALQAYQLNYQAVRVELLSTVNNITFKLLVDEMAGKQRQFALRIHPPGTAGEGQIRAELAWLKALRQETELKTPLPVMTNRGDPLAAVTIGPDIGPLYCVLFEWLEGQFVPTRQQTPALAQQVGRFIGALHQHSQAFSARQPVERRRLDLEGLFDWETIERLESSNTFFTTEHIALFSAVYERINDIFSQLGDSPEVFGLIHADLIWKNYFFHEAGVGALDFDSCSWGYYLYDLAPTLLGYRDEPHYPALRQALLAGYRQIRPLPSWQEQFLDMLIAARHIISCCWLARRLDDPHLRQQAETILAYRISEIRNLLDGASP